MTDRETRDLVSRGRPRWSSGGYKKPPLRERTRAEWRGAHIESTCSQLSSVVCRSVAQVGRGLARGRRRSEYHHSSGASLSVYVCRQSLWWLTRAPTSQRREWVLHAGTSKPQDVNAPCGRGPQRSRRRRSLNVADVVGSVILVSSSSPLHTLLYPSRSDVGLVEGGFSKV